MSIDWDRVLVVGVDFGTLSSRAPVAELGSAV